MKKILIYNSGGGIGDSIQLFPLLLSLKNHFKKSKFFYLGAHQNHFKGKLKEYKLELETFDLGLKYFGFRWWHLFFVNKKASEKIIGLSHLNPLQNYILIFFSCANNCNNDF